MASFNRGTCGPRAEILQVLDSTEEEASGPSYSVPRLCTSLGELGRRVELLTVARENSMVSHGFYDHLKYRQDCRKIPIASQGRFSAGLKQALRSAENARIIHAHGLWQ